ncbi:MAG: response regulator [Bacteroidales bacterium]|nr:response regulator [Bacteroidales bacterium]
MYGTWSEQYKSVEIIIKPPFWQTWWFRTTIVLILIFVFIAVFRIRVWRLRYQKRLLTKEVAIQTKTLRQQNLEIIEQKKKLEQQSDILQVKLLELHNQKEDLEALNIQLTEQTTEILATNKKLTTAIDTKNKLLSIIAHDLKNPFNVIFVAAKSLLSSFKSESNKEQKEYSEYIFSASKNIYSILSNLLDWAMSQSGLVSFTPMNIRMQQFITAELESNRLFAAQKNIKLVGSCNEKTVCFADEQMLRIMIRNLIQNSVKFTPEGGMISINCSEDDSYVKIEIIDTGIGMDENTMKTLFEVSSVISEKGTRDEEGRGLGLLVVKEFIEKNNGTIEVKSKKNKGSNFILKLPSGKNYSENEPNTILPTEKKDIINKNPNISILLIDDNDRLREQLSKSLGDYYSVLNCNNAIDAIEIYKKNKIDLFISDIVMQDMDGITFCNYIKKELQLSIPIILITGLDDNDIQVKAYNCGADAFIKKPFEFELLLARIQNLLKQSSRTDSMTFTTSAKTQKPIDDVFLEKLKDEVEKGIPNADFSVEILADIMGISRASLFRKTRRILGISPSEYIQHARMQVAARFLQDKQIRVSEVAYMVGFSDPHYFSNCFTKHYGISPTEYKEKY